MKWTGVVYLLIIVSLSALSSLAGFSTPQVLSLSIFFMVLFGTIFFWRFRLSFSLIGIFLLLSMGLLDIPHLIEFAGLDIILFLIGMMILVGYLEENHFFESLVNTLIRYIGPRPLLLLVTLMVVGAISAALVDEVTSILFMTATMIHLTSRFGVNPIPFVIIQVFATNIGSSATVVGNHRCHDSYEGRLHLSGFPALGISHLFLCPGGYHPNLSFLLLEGNT
jgi:Na+/H+ antiporter NhaD/arsenite permease-like protein